MRHNIKLFHRILESIKNYIKGKGYYISVTCDKQDYYIYTIILMYRPLLNLLDQLKIPYTKETPTNLLNGISIKKINYELIPQETLNQMVALLKLKGIMQ